MRNLLFVVFLGLVAVVRSTPDDNLAETQDDVYREAVTDGYLIDQPFALTTESPQETRTVQGSQQLSFEPKETEGSADYNDKMSLLLQNGGQRYAPTTQSVSHTRRLRHLFSESKETEGSADYNDKMSLLLQNGGQRYASTTQSVSHTRRFRHLFSESKETEGSADYNDKMSLLLQNGGQRYAPTTQSVSHTHSIQQLMFESTETEGSGSQSSQVLIDRSSDESTSTSPSMTSISTTEVSTTSSKSMASPHTRGEQPQGRIQAPSVGQDTVGGINKGHNTPSWIIIVAFIVGVASLVMVCVAIATRDKWNGPSQTFQPQTKTDSSNQQMELEMETFLQRDQPRENGQANEYTVIPLEEFPEEN